ncbi:MAG: transglycosylase SLT domain-containing protein [Gammaproteobacteria bacterium]|nr:transglycosylase SLT domain-containing protein [Gammaproteobacteria bacterium]
MNVSPFFSFRSLFLLLLPLLLQSTVVVAVNLDKIDSQRWQRERALFVLAEKAIAADQDVTSHLAELKNYPLLPYLEYQRLKPRLHKLPVAEIDVFFSRYGESAPALFLRAALLDELARQQNWKLYLKYYQESSKVERQCDYRHALLQSGREAEALAEIDQIWLSGKSLPDACDPLFNRWIAKGGLSSDTVWARIDKALAAENPSLATYLGRFLSESDKKWLDGWLELYQQPSKIFTLALLQQTHTQRQAILVDTLKRMVKADEDKGAAAWQQIALRYPFDNAAKQQVEREIGLRMTWRNHPDAFAQMLKVTPQADDTVLQETRLRLALRLQRWSHMVSWIEAMPAELSQALEWRYWYARALEAEGNAATAKAVFTELAADRSYYGFLSADRVGLPYNLQHLPLTFSSQELAQLAQSPALQRVQELLLLDRNHEAKREWERGLKQLDNETMKVAASLAQQWEWHDRAIFALSRTGYWDDLQLRFPLLYRDIIHSEASRNQLPLTWVYAVIRQESVFMHDAVSPAGARGLMQLMPATAESMAKELKRSYQQEKLFEPAFNIALGTRYLQKVAGQLDNNPVLATAAYNAGPHRVKKWLPANGQMDADIWAETIPFKETREYVRRVLSYSILYGKRLGAEPISLKQLMAAIGSDPSSAVVASR